MVIENIGIYQAKNKLSEILERVEAGETVAITRHGKQIALITPVHQDRSNSRQAIERLRQIRKGSRLAGLKVRDLRDEGRP